MPATRVTVDSTVGELTVQVTAPELRPAGFALQKSAFSEPEREKFDVEALQEWEDDGGAFIPFHLRSFA